MNIIEPYNIFRTFMPKEIFHYMRDKTNYSRDESGESIEVTTLEIEHSLESCSI